MFAKKGIVFLSLFVLLMSSFVAAGSFYDFLEQITGRVPLNDPNNQGDAPGGNASPPGLAGEPSPPRCGDGVCSTAEAHTDDGSAVYCPEDCDYVVAQEPEPDNNTGVVQGPPVCEDTDGGFKPDVFGVVTSNGESHHDLCYSQYRVEEFGCTANGFDSQVFPCLHGVCADGKCVKKDIAVATTYTYVPASGVVQKFSLGSLSVPAFLSLVRDEPRSLGNVQLSYSVVSGKNMVTLTKNFEVPSQGFLEIDGVRYKVSIEDNSLVLQHAQGKKVSAPVTDRSSIVSSKIGATQQLRTSAQPLLGRDTFFRRLAASFSRSS